MVQEPGVLQPDWERSVRLFVDRSRLEEAQAIADRVLAVGETAPPEAD